MTTVTKVAEQYRCDRCQRVTTVRGTPADVAAAIEAVRCRHRDGHATGDHLDDIGHARATARANARARRATRRAEARAAARRRDHRRAS